MKATVTTGKGLGRRNAEVEISARSEMTPEAAIAFRDMAFGVAATATVSGGGKVYRVSGIGTKAKARLITK